jgi:hypothetical protein
METNDTQTKEENALEAEGDSVQTVVSSEDEKCKKSFTDWDATLPQDEQYWDNLSPYDCLKMAFKAGGESLS